MGFVEDLGDAILGTDSKEGAQQAANQMSGIANKIWAQTLFDEAISFPNAAHDDQVDAMVMAVHYMKDSWHLQHPHDPYYSDSDNTYKKNKATYWKVSN